MPDELVELMKSKYPDFGNRWTLHFSAQSLVLKKAGVRLFPPMRRAKIQTEDGTILRAYLHSPGPGAHPGIVMCPGFGGVKPLIDPYAALFAEAGFAVVNHDNRGWGTSEGEPRQELNVFKQLTDFRDAITFAESQPEFDAKQGFGVWGSSFSGGLAIVTAANDSRVRCVVAQIPNVSGHRNAVKLFTAELREIRRRAATDRVARLAGEPPMMVPMLSEDPEELCAFPDQFPEEYREAIESGVWNNRQRSVHWRTSSSSSPRAGSPT